MPHMWYDRQGNSLNGDYEIIEKYLTDMDYKIVAKDDVGDTTVSTVWLGLDHAFGGGPPVIFETLLFGGDYDGEMWRYQTEDQALKNHTSIVNALEAGEDPNAYEGDD